jgi:hypothetical protein
MKKGNKREEKMLTIREAAELTGAAQSSIRVWLADEAERKKRFPGARKETSPIGDYWLIPESDVAGFQKGKPGRPLKGSEPVRKSRRKVQQ